MFFVRQGATHKIVVGPAVAVANGYVPVTSLTLSGADEAEAILHDNGTVVDISGYTFAAITTADGYYHLTLQSGISNTVGHVTLVINDDSLCLPLRVDYTVLEEAVYDALFAASAPGYVVDQPVNVTKWLGTAAATPTVAGVPEVDLTHWLGTAAATPTVAGVPEVDVTHVGGATTNVAAMATNVDAILTDTAEIGVAGAGLTAINLPDQTMNITGNITGNLSGSVGSVTAGVTLAASAVQAIWDALTSALTTVGSIGKLLVDRIDAAISSRSSHAATDVWAAGTRTLTAGTNIALAKGTGVTGFTDLDAAGVRTAVGLASANLDTQLADLPTVAEFEARTLASASYATASLLTTIAGYLDTEIAAILADTDELQTDWANGGRLDLLLDAVKAITDAIGGTAAAKLALTLGSASPTGVAESGTLSTTAMTTDLSEATDDHYNNRVVLWTSGALAGQARAVTDYAGATGMLSFAALTEAPQAGDAFILI